jgi:hypothetical protein
MLGAARLVAPGSCRLSGGPPAYAVAGGSPL